MANSSGVERFLESNRSFKEIRERDDAAGYVVLVSGGRTNRIVEDYFVDNFGSPIASRGLWIVENYFNSFHAFYRRGDVAYDLNHNSRSTAVRGSFENERPIIRAEYLNSNDSLSSLYLFGEEVTVHPKGRNYNAYQREGRKIIDGSVALPLGTRFDMEHFEGVMDKLVDQSFEVGVTDKRTHFEIAAKISGHWIGDDAKGILSEDHSRDWYQWLQENELMDFRLRFGMPESR